MKSKLESLLEKGEAFISELSKDDLEYKPAKDKWSKKEILGHLIDSGINNLQRFTEIQFTEKPYVIRNYNQTELVKANAYQNAAIDELIDLWISINYRIINLIDLQTEESLSYKIEFSTGKISDLKFLFEDYINHMEHHLNQMIK